MGVILQYIGVTLKYIVSNYNI